MTCKCLVLHSTACLVNLYLTAQLVLVHVSILEAMLFEAKQCLSTGLLWLTFGKSPEFQRKEMKNQKPMSAVLEGQGCLPRYVPIYETDMYMFMSAS